MTPKVGKEFYKLDSIGKVCYLNGMPLRQCRQINKSFMFRSEKVTKGLLSAAQQQEAFKIFEQNKPDSPQFTIFSTGETDDVALEATSHLIRNYIENGNGWNSFLFIGPQDMPPRGDEDVKDLYVAIGVDERDPDVAGWLRTWLRARLGVPIWVCLTAKKPSDWYLESLRIRPDFLFNLKTSGRSAG